MPQGVLGLPAYALVPAHAFCAGRLDERWPAIATTAALILVSELGVLVDGASAVPALFIPPAGWAAARRPAHARAARARIAAELHDIVAHAISVMVVQASAGQRLAAIDSQRTADAFEAIAGAAQQAERDIGRLVELLSGTDHSAPAPDVAVIEELVARAGASGLTVKLRLEGDRGGLPPIVGQTAFRVVQEGLTNAIRHASGADVEVLVLGGRDELLVEVVNGPATGDGLLAGAGTGTGLTGLRERVGALGGELHAGPTAAGGWRLRARLRRVAAMREC